MLLFNLLNDLKEPGNAAECMQKTLNTFQMYVEDWISKYKTCENAKMEAQQEIDEIETDLTKFGEKFCKFRGETLDSQASIKKKVDQFNNDIKAPNAAMQGELKH